MKNKVIVGKKILFIGDIHGNSEWEDLVKEGLKSFYEIVFLGDYVDSFHVRPVEQIHNLNNLVNFLSKQRKIGGKVTALLGNHDYAYIYNYPGISGHNFIQGPEYRKIFTDNLDLFQMAWGYASANTGRYTLASHAGLTQTFWSQFMLPEMNNPESTVAQLIAAEERGNGSVDGDPFKPARKLAIHEKLNFFRDKSDILWKVGSDRGGWGTPGPLWGDFRELLEDPYEGIDQVVGHTPKISPSVVPNQNGCFYACIDNWGNKKTASLIVSL
jgi:predicted phosphodiesterase